MFEPTHYSLPSVAVLIIGGGALVGIWIGLFLRIQLWIGILLSMIVNTIVIWHFGRLINNDSDVLLLASENHITGVAISAAAGIALLFKGYQAAILDRVTANERLTGVAGVRVWLSPRNLIVVALFIAGGYMSDELNIVSATIVGFGLLVAYPLINTLLQPSEAVAIAPRQAPAEERQRVLALVEAGKITAEEGAELINAMAQSQAAGTELPPALSGPRRVMLVGAAVVLVGFFLPWFTLNESQGMHDAMSSMQQNLQQVTGMPQPMPSAMPPAFAGGAEPSQVQMRNVFLVSVRGGDVRDGLGWILLAAAVAAAGLPFVSTPRTDNARQQRNFLFAALIAGTVALLYLLSNSFNPITAIEPGFIAVIVGYALLWFAAIRNEIAGRPAFQAVPALS